MIALRNQLERERILPLGPHPSRASLGCVSLPIGAFQVRVPLVKSRSQCSGCSCPVIAGKNHQDYNPPLLVALAVMAGPEWITETEPVRIMFGTLKQPDALPIPRPSHPDITT